MSEIDWSKAPFDATHYAPNSDAGLRACWYKMEDGEWFYLTEAQDFGDSDTWQRSRVELEDKVERPKQWAGEGLPPVGTVCEYQYLKGEWVGCDVVAHFYSGASMVAAIIVNHDRSREVSQGISGEFRPIKTPEQIAAEARQLAIDEMVNEMRKSRYDQPKTDIAPVNMANHYAAGLYDAGYRRVTPWND